MKTPWYTGQKLPVGLVAGLGGLFTVVDLACAQPWAITDAPSLSWKALASSADGTRLVAAANARSYFGGPPAPIYVSTNAGATWTQTSAPSNNWSSVACSADGMKLVAVSAPYFYRPPGFGDGLIYTSPDGGDTWLPASVPSNNWSCVASSADGIKLVAVAAPVWTWDLGKDVGEGAVYCSPDAGATWTRTTAPSNTWTSVASSADGTKLVALAGLRRGTNSDYIGEGAIYRSSDSGATWTRTSTLNTNWSSVAASADGTKLLAAAGARHGEWLTGLIYTSTNSGATWTATTAPSDSWTSVASSADGARLVAMSSSVNGSGLIYTSSDSGATWIATDLFSSQWAAVACSADGHRVVAGGYHTSLYTLPYSGPWRLADAPAKGLTSVASSADGTRLVAVPVRGNTICTSTNSGATWTSTPVPNDRWTSVASSADGVKLVAAAWIEDSPAAGDGLIYTSGNSGVTWTPTTAPRNRWHSVASSADGAMLVAVADLVQHGNGLIYTSSNSGATWMPTSARTNRWCSVASSADGSRLVAASGGDGLIYTSGDSGQSWAQTSAPTNYWQALASSADGTKLVAAAMTDASGNLGGIYTSGDSGATWTKTSAPNQYWWCVASSDDGTELVAGAGLPNPWIYTSTNSGVTWTRAATPAASWWYGVASSADGDRLVAVSGDGFIYSVRPPAPAPPLPPSPRLTIDRSGANLDLSWLVPSTGFVLQQNSDLGSTNWVHVPASPTLDYTNLHHQVTLTPSLGSSFYRLKQQ